MRKLLDIARTMPSLAHWPDRTKRFDVLQSQVCAWLVAQPEVRRWLFQIVKGRKLIRFDPATRTWQGVQTSARSQSAGRPDA